MNKSQNNQPSGNKSDKKKICIHILRHANKCKVKENTQWFPGKQRGELSKAIRELLSVTDIVSILNGTMVS